MASGPVAADRVDRFLGKVQERTARCRGGEKALEGRERPWLDWPRYWAVGAAAWRSRGLLSGFPIFGKNERGVEGALLDLEYLRIELLNFNELARNRHVSSGSPQPDPQLISRTQAAIEAADIALMTDAPAHRAVQAALIHLGPDILVFLNSVKLLCVRIANVDDAASARLR